MARVDLIGLNKSFGPNRVVRDVNLSVGDGEFMVLVGPSGCGKSTILRMVAGLEEVSDGLIKIAGREVTGLEPARRNLAMVFQNYALYPHMTVYKNLAFPLKMRGENRDAIAARVRETAEILGIAEMLDRKPKTLSGGQMQRVALGRAIVRNPLVFLFDEPLSNLDAKMRVEMRAEITRLHRRLGTTMIYVTHDQEEAMTMGSRIAVLDSGVLQQVDEPMNVYHRPANRFVASFIGSPAMNFFRGAVLNSVFVTAGINVPADDVPDGDAILGVRPHDIVRADAREDVRADAREDVRADVRSETDGDVPDAVADDLAGAGPADQDGAPPIRALVDSVESLGSETHCGCTVEKKSFLVSLPGHHALQRGQKAGFFFLPERLHYFHAETGERLA